MPSSTLVMAAAVYTAPTSKRPVAYGLHGARSAMPGQAIVRRAREKAHEPFRRFSHATADAVGSPWMFLAAIVVVLVWAATGPYFDYSDTWQLIINTGTTILTFLM